jgi:hypothetical protein
MKYNRILKSFKNIIIIYIFFILFCCCNKQENDDRRINFCTEISSPIVDYIKYLDSKKTYINNNSFEDFKLLIPSAVFLKEAYWGDEIDTLCVSFIDGSPIVQEKVMKIAKEWEEHCRIKFKVDSNCHPDITISLVGESSKYNSIVGKESRCVIPSMNLQQIEHEEDFDFRSIVLHEFGHALGLVHEHQHPKSEIPWNKKYVYDYYKNEYGWHRTKVDTHVFMRYGIELVEATEFDTLSIMIYQIPSDF